MFQCCSEETAYKWVIKDPVSTPTFLACVKPGLHKKDTCADLRSHVLVVDLPKCFAFTNLVKPNVSTTDTAPIRGPATLVASQSRLWLWEKNNMVSVLICLCLSQLWQLGSTCIMSKRPETSFPLFVPPGITDRGMHRVPLNGCTAHSRLRMHTIQLSASPPRHRPKFMCR